MTNLEKLKLNHVLILTKGSQRYYGVPCNSNLYSIKNITYGYNATHNILITKPELIEFFHLDSL